MGVSEMGLAETIVGSLNLVLRHLVIATVRNTKKLQK